MRRALLAFLAASGLLIGGLVAVSPAQALTTVKVSAGFSNYVVQKNSRVNLSGLVSPARPGHSVYLQAYSGSKWVTKKQAVLNSSSRYLMSWYATGVGVSKWRVIKPATRYDKGAVSPTLTLRVYGWRPLTGDTSVADDADGYTGKWYDRGARYTNGQLTTRTLASYGYGWNDNSAGDVGWTEYNLGRKCDQVKALAGLDDDESSAAAKARLVITADGFQKYQRDFTLGTSALLNVNTTGALRVRISQINLTPDDTEYYFNLGALNARCFG
jgi:hypothetical protein